MVQYVSPGKNQCPVKKTPFALSNDEWAVMANEMNDIEPTNMAHKDIICDETWIKQMWNAGQKWLHQTFVQCNRSIGCRHGRVVFAKRA
jgi:hypothetical protein